VIRITPKDLIYIIPDLINLFLSGFIFMYVYNWLNNKKTDTSILTIGSLFVSFLVKSFYSVCHSFILPNVEVNDSVKVIIFSATGCLLALLCTYLKRTKLFTKLLYSINNKSVNDDIFDDIIDYNKKTMMKVYLKETDVYYIGRFSIREENGINSWISLVEYCSVNKNTNEKIFDPTAGGLNSSVTFSLSNVERIEIIYEKDSEVWRKLFGNNCIGEDVGNINKETDNE